MKHRRISLAATLVVVILVATLLCAASALALTNKQTLGKHIYFDTRLSTPDGLACAGCHTPPAGWADPDASLPVSAGINLGDFGGRNAPSAGYAATSPTFFYNVTSAEYIGGQFWDGRAATLADQAKGPFLNPVEMANPDKAAVVNDVATATYAALFLKVYGADAFADVDAAYDNIADAIAAYERSPEVCSYTSTYDAYIAGGAVLTAQEAQGLKLFSGKAGCSGCHSHGSMTARKNALTTHKYANLGVPSNPLVLSLAGLPVDYADPGLGGFLANAGLAFSAENWGKMKIPTLRNVAQSGPYTHNGYFASLHDVVSFLNTRDVPGAWPEPEVAVNMTTRVGDLGLTESEVDAVVAFLGTLTDASLTSVREP
jgi:cytochrome c peroxidase